MEYLGGLATVLYDGGRLSVLLVWMTQSMQILPCCTITRPSTTANTPPRIPSRKKKTPCESYKSFPVVNTYLFIYFYYLKIKEVLKVSLIVLKYEVLILNLS